jgi:hypothetical protein
MFITRLGLAGAALAIVALTAVPSAAQRTVSWGAIAYGPKGQSWSSAYGENSADEANQKALGVCAKHGDDCQVVTSFSNACAAVAVIQSTHATFVATDAKRGTAELQARQACTQQNLRECRVAASACAQP